MVFVGWCDELVNVSAFDEEGNSGGLLYIYIGDSGSW